MNSTLTYYRLNSFRQDYTPTYSSPNRGFDGFTQINYNNIYLGDILNLTIGINRKLGERFSLCLNMMIPLYTRWRNDKIFGDDPSTFTCPSYSLGGSISVAYRFVEEK
ncbi:MAG: hypothetical protein JSS93_06920 [Bacteroidetes bacterium]|nr:hypothetical protein [Bacteroidota bacterium]